MTDHESDTVPVAPGNMFVDQFSCLRAVGVNRLLFRGIRQRDQPQARRTFRVVSVEMALLPEVAGAVLLVSGSDLGHGLVGFGSLLSMGVGILGAWVLLVEILR